MRWLEYAAGNGHTIATNIILRTLDNSSNLLNFQILSRICTEQTWQSCSPRFVDKLAVCYERGDGVEANVDEAKRWYSRGVQRENHHSMCRYGDLIEEEDPEGAKALYYRARNMKPNYALGRIRLYFYHIRGRENQGIPDYNRARIVLTEGLGDPGKSYKYLGLFHDGSYHNNPYEHPHFPRDPNRVDYITLDLQLAYHYYGIAANNEDVTSILKIAKSYENIPGFTFDFRPRDMLRAFLYYKKGADILIKVSCDITEEHKDMCFVTGLFFENSSGYDGFIETDIQQAIRYYMFAARNGHARSIDKLITLNVIDPIQ